MTANTASQKKNPFDRIIDSIEWMAALFVGIVAANIFIAVVLRKFFDTSIPDSYDFGRLLLGILIFGVSLLPAIAAITLPSICCGVAQAHAYAAGSTFLQRWYFYW